MSLSVVEDTGAVFPEPDWESLLSDVLEVAQAKEHWRRVTTELKERRILSPANAHAMQRLVMSYVIYDRSLREVAERGAVTKPKRGNSRSIARLSPHFSAMREMASDAATLEAEFGISPRRRSVAGKAEGRSKRNRAADEFVGSTGRG